MHIDHPHVSDEINQNIRESELQGGCFMKDVADGRTLSVQTKSRVYRIEKRSDDTYISGHPRYCPTPTKCAIQGSTWGGSMLKVGFVGRGMYLEFSTAQHGTVTTSQIHEITEGD